MKLIKINKPQVNESKEVSGLISCRMEYEVKTARGRLDYAGPPFAPEMWHQVMSFFRWTHKEMDSESQARLYVNQRLGRWGAWAFPQAARTGMSARELPEPETPAQARERFASWDSKPSDEWLYFGTAHHHCSAGAFQSSTDEQNERNQDGLHLTVGGLDADRHELHARFYLDGNCFEPDFSRFWPVDPGLAAKVPPGMLDELARYQMGEKITVDFPDAWRKNIVEVPSREPAFHSRHDWGLDQSELDIPHYARLEEALEEIARRCAAGSVTEEQWVAELNALATNDVGQVIIDACLNHGVTPGELLRHPGEFDHQAG